MPGFTTHYLFGWQTCRQMRRCTLKQTLLTCHAAYSLGLQGPDIFFYDIWTSLFAKKNPGSTAHTADTRKFLCRLLESPKIFPSQKDRQTAQAYTAGFIGHYQLDTVCHPYIYAATHYSQKPHGYIGQHLLLETDIDTALLWHYKRRRPSEFCKNKSIRLSKRQRSAIAELLYYAFSKTYPELGMTKRRIIQAICGMQAGTKLLYDPMGRKKIWIRRFESIIPGYPLLSPLLANDSLIFHKDPCNLKHALWTNPWDAKRTSRESFFDLFEKAQAQYVLLLKHMNIFFFAKPASKKKSKALAQLLSGLGNLCYHSGLSCAP